MFDVITIGGAVWDALFVTDKGYVIPTPENPTEQNLFAFEYGAKIISDKVYTSAGGGAANTAVGLARLGLAAAAYVALGEDQNGEIIKDTLKRESVSIDLVEKLPKAMTGFSFILVNAADGDHTIFSYRGANEKLKAESLKIKKTILKADYVYITSLTGDWPKLFSLVLDSKKENPRLKIAFNPGATQLRAGFPALERMIAASEIIFVNKDEAVELVLSRNPEAKNQNFNDIKFLMENILNCGVRTAVITDGKNGAYVGNSGSVMRAPAISQTRVDTTGAGDSFGSAFLGSYIMNRGDLETSLKYGIINSNSVVNEYGAEKGILTKKKIISLLDSVNIQHLP